MESNLLRAWFASLCKLSFTSTPVFIMTICRCLFHCLFPLALKIPVGTLLRLELFLLKRIAETGAAKGCHQLRSAFSNCPPTHGPRCVQTYKQANRYYSSGWRAASVPDTYRKVARYSVFSHFMQILTSVKTKMVGVLTSALTHKVVTFVTAEMDM